MSKIRLAEKIFSSYQGEGDRTGVLSIWIRLFGCNLSCSGFYQDDPADPSSYILPYQTIDISRISRLEEVPVFHRGCDSAYAWSSLYKKFAIDYASGEELVKQAIEPLMYRDSDGNPVWTHPVTHNQIELCITGGEPMLQQAAIIEILKAAKVAEKNIPVQIETNGTQPLKQSFIDFITENSIDVHFNISPKLFYVSGEKDVVKVDIIKQYQDLTNSGILKIVINNDDRAWAELIEHTKTFRESGIWLPIMIMPVGATKEQQENSDVISQIANRALREGYHISGRLHATIWGNTVGV